MAAGAPGRAGRSTPRALIANGISAVAARNRRGVAAWQPSLLAQGFVPMFLLLSQLSLAERGFRHLAAGMAAGTGQHRLQTRG